MPFKVAMLRGYHHPRSRSQKESSMARRKHHKRKSFRGQKSKFTAAAKACKGKKIGAFRACMRSKLKK